MNEITLKLLADDYRHLVNVLADLPNRSNTYGLIVNIEQQFKAQLDTQNAESQETEVLPEPPKK